MILNTMGKIVFHEWQRLLFRFPMIELDESVIMPNHFHGTIIVGDLRRGTGDLPRMNVLDESPVPLRVAGQKFGKPIPGSIPTIIRSFKSYVSFRINLLPGNPGHPVWQRDYYDHIIRDEIDWANIRLYIQTNPENWGQDGEKLP